MVLLGRPSSKRDNSMTPYVSRLGGSPVWFHGIKEFDDKVLTCDLCNLPLAFVAQVYAPIDEPRALFIFGCNSMTCSVDSCSWRVFRYQVEEKREIKPLETDLQDACEIDWDSDSDEESLNPIATSLSDIEALLIEREERTLITSQSKAKVNLKIDQPETLLNSSGNEQFPSVCLEVEDEPDEIDSFEYEEKLYEKYLAEECEELHVSPDAADSKNTSEPYERTPVAAKLYDRYISRLQRCPTQCLRYDYDGQPLYASPKSASWKPAKCPCGRDRVFEFQLMPGLIHALQADKYSPKTRIVLSNEMDGKIKADIGMLFSSVVIWSCPDSCDKSSTEVAYIEPSF